MVGRFAPSPSGALHLGNIRTALVAWLQARLSGGAFIIRIDDLDTPRNKPDSVEQILADLHWLGLHCDQVIYQSKRTARYTFFFEQLLNQGWLYPCRCSRRDIIGALGADASLHPSLQYPGTCRPANKTAVYRINADTPVAWRFRATDKTVCFEDKILGSQYANVAEYPGDFIVKRKDNIFAYQLASVVDDIDFGLTDVVRGSDLLDSAPRQISLFTAIGAPIPQFWHVSVMTNDQGEKLAKRDGADSIATEKSRGRTAAQIIGQLAASYGLVEKGKALTADQLLRELTLPQMMQCLKLF